MAAQMVQISENVDLLVAREQEPRAKESGWWVMRSFNRRTLTWKDYPMPGRGVTLWLSAEAAQRLGVNN